MTVRARRGCGLGGTHGGVALLAAILLIASGLAAGCRANPRVVESPFAADAEYPQLFWMFALDKAGASSKKFSIAATGWLDAEGLTIEVMLAGDVNDGCETGVRRVGEGGAVVLVCPAVGAPATRALLVVRPNVARSGGDFPVQRAPRDHCSGERGAPSSWQELQVV
jgi:hypothetical protein